MSTSSDSKILSILDRGSCVIAILLFAAIVLLYSPVRNFSFLNFDDNIYITENSIVQSGLSWSNIRWAFDPMNGRDWHPLTWISHMIDVSTFGIDAGAHHLVNVFFHACNTVLVFIVLCIATGRVRESLVVALLFGVHPMRLESVAWVSERKDVLSVFFGLLSVLFYACYAKGKRWVFYLSSGLFFLLSILSKPTLVTLPLLLLLVDRWPLERMQRLKVLLAEKIPFVLIAFFGAVSAVVSQHANGGFRTLSSIPLEDRFNIAFPGYLAYLGKLFWPTHLSIFYPMSLYPSGIAAGAFIALIAITFIVQREAKIAPYLVGGWLWFIISLLPMIGFVTVGGQAFADRWSYVPHVGLLVSIVFYLADHVNLSSKLKLLLSMFCIAFLSWMTIMQLPSWRDSKSVFMHALEVSPNNFMAHTNLGVVLAQEGNYADAGFHYEEAVRLNPTYPEALNNLGTIRGIQGKYLEARELFQRALSIRSDFVTAQNNLALAERDIHALGSAP